MRLLELAVVLSALVSLCWSKAPPGYVKKPDNDKDPPKYEYSYDVKDGVGSQGHVETRDGEFAHGVYYVAIPDGGQNVQYFADDWGYHPLVSYASSSAHGSSRAQFALGEKAVAALRQSPGTLIDELRSSPGAKALVVPKTVPRIIPAVVQQPAPVAVQSPAVVVPISSPPQPLTLISGAATGALTSGSEISQLQRLQSLSGRSQIATALSPVTYQQNVYVPSVAYSTLQPGLSYGAFQYGGASAIRNDVAREQALASLAGSGALGVQSSGVGGEGKVEITSYLADTNVALPFGARTNGKKLLSSIQLTQGSSAIRDELVGDQKILAVTQPPVVSGYTSLRPIVVSQLGIAQNTHVESSSASSSYVSTSSGSALTTGLGGVPGGGVYSSEKPILLTSTARYSTVTPSPIPATVLVTPPPKHLLIKYSGYSQQPIVVPDNIQHVPQLVEENDNVKSIQYSSSGDQVVFEESITDAQSNLNNNQENFVVASGVDNRLQQKSYVENLPLNTYAADYNQQFFEATKAVQLGQYLQGNPPCDPQIIHVEKQVPVTVEIEKPIVIERTRIVEVEKPVTIESTKYVEVEKPVHIESTKLVAVDRPVPVAQPVPVEVTKLVPVDRPLPYPQPYAVPQPYGVPQPYPYPYPVPQAVRVPVPHLVPYPQVVPVPYKEYHPVYVQGKQTTKTFNSYRKDSSFGGSLKSSVLYADQVPARPLLPSSSRSGKNRNFNLSRYRPHPKKLCIEYGGFKPPMVPSEQIDEDPEYEESV